MRDTSPYWPTYEEIVGTPAEVYEDSRYPDIPLRTMWAKCLVCGAFTVAGRYWFDDERILLHDHTHYTASDWNDEGTRYSTGVTSRLHKLWCSGCETLQFHKALNERAIRGILMKRGLV